MQVGWRVPVAIGYLPAVVVVIGLFFTPESPRWLISKGRKEQALVSLDRLRPTREVDNGTTTAEVNALEEAIVEAKSVRNGRWIDLFNRRYFRRSMVGI